MSNGNGNLIASHPGNVNAVRSGVYSRTGRVLAPRADEIAEALMQLPHVQGLDCLGIEEVASIVARLEAIDADLAKRGPKSRTLLDMKVKLGRELRAWLKEIGATLRARSEWAKTLATGGLGEQIRRRIAEAEQT